MLDEKSWCPLVVPGEEIEESFTALGDVAHAAGRLQELTLFVAAGFEGSLGRGTITVAHIMFCISFVVVTVKARIAGLDPRLEQAAMDLYADEKTTFRKVTFPLVLPGIVAAALLAFSLSFDDFVITNFTSGQTVTFPMYVWGASGRGIPPEANVVGAIMFAIAILVVLVPEVFRRRRKV